MLDLIDPSKDTVTAETLLSGYTAHNAAGTKITGTLADKTGTADYNAEASIDGTNKRIKLKIVTLPFPVVAPVHAPLLGIVPVIKLPFTPAFFPAKMSPAPASAPLVSILLLLPVIPNIVFPFTSFAAVRPIRFAIVVYAAYR